MAAYMIFTILVPDIVQVISIFLIFLLFYCGITAPLLVLHAFSDANWAGNKDDWTPISVYVVYLGKNPISCSEKQLTVSCSSIEAEYRAVSPPLLNCVVLLQELGVKFKVQFVVYNDNVEATNLCANPSLIHSPLKHIDIDFYFVHDKVRRINW